MVVPRREGRDAEETPRPEPGALEGVVVERERRVGGVGVGGYEVPDGDLGAEEGAAEVEFGDGNVSVGGGEGVGLVLLLLLLLLVGVGRWGRCVFYGRGVGILGGFVLAV